MIRFGLCCVFHEAPIRFRTATAKYVLKLRSLNQDPLHYLSQIILDNLQALEQAISYCGEHHIGAFRINSQFMPLYTHPEVKYQLKDFGEAEIIYQKFERCRELAKMLGIRLTLHPDQFVILNSPNERVVKASMEELEYHGLLAELIGADVINIHAGGVYGDKSAALDRLMQQIPKLSKRVRQRLTLENDDKSFTPEDLLPVCRAVGIPLVYDIHHHRCLPDQFTIDEASQLCYQTWNREPLFHISSPREGWSGKKLTSHHDYIDIHDFPLFWLSLDPLTIEIEAKAKEVAIARLMKELNLIY